MNLSEISLEAVKDTPAKELQALIDKTEDFGTVVGDGVLLTDEDIRTAARKYIRIKLELGDETVQEAKEADPAYIPPEPGFDHINVKEASDPQEAMIKAGFQNKDEMLKLLEALRRDAQLNEMRKNDLDKREVDIQSRETVLAGKEASVEKKALEVGKQYAEYQRLFALVEAARKQGVIT